MKTLNYPKRKPIENRIYLLERRFNWMEENYKEVKHHLRGYQKLNTALTVMLISAFVIVLLVIQ